MRAILVCLTLLAIAACAPVTTALVTPSELPPLPGEKEPTVNVAPPVLQLMKTLQLRMAGHSTLPDAEVVLCLYGRVSRDTVYVERAGEADYSESVSMWQGMTTPAARYWPCKGDDYIGAFHTHPAGPWGDGCWHSPLDVEAFMQHTQEIIQIVGCTREGRVFISSRVKRGYSRRS